MTKYFVDQAGNYIGAFDGAEPPAGSVEVPSAPSDARQPWTGSGWGAIPVSVDDFKSAIQAHMDQAAESAGYDDIKTAVTYADEPAVPKFQAEGRAFRAWRSQCWAYGYQEMDKVLGGTRPMPTVEQMISELPALVLP